MPSIASKSTIRRFMYLRSALALLLCLIFYSANVAHADETSTQVSKNKANLFSMSLEQVLDIRVRGNHSENPRHSGIHVVTEKEFTRIIRKASVQSAQHPVVYDATRLMVDGYSVGQVSTLFDLKLYRTIFRHRIRRAELYLGESAYLLSDGQTKAVINLVTKDSESEEASK